jgi:hypothetical protein
MKPLSCILVIMFLPITLLIGGFLFIVYKIIVKTRASAWKGTVTDKLYNTKRDDNDNPHHVSQFYTLVVKTDEGLTRKIAVTKTMYDSCNVGDKLDKPKGALNPVKV